MKNLPVLGVNKLTVNKQNTNIFIIKSNKQSLSALKRSGRVFIIFTNHGADN